jgi:hypothetical protein
MNRTVVTCISLLLSGAALAQAPAMTSPMAAAPANAALAPAAGAEVYIISPADGATVSGPVTVRFGLKGMGIAPAGIKFDNTGHHHLLVDTDISALKLDESLPASEHVLHFGKGQTETTLTLAPGRHTLQLLFADYTHRSFDPPLKSAKITITVK